MGWVRCLTVFSTVMSTIIVLFGVQYLTSRNPVYLILVIACSVVCCTAILTLLYKLLSNLGEGVGGQGVAPKGLKPADNKTAGGKKYRRQDEEEEDLMTGLVPGYFQYADLEAATRGFSRTLGKGGFGTVFEGQLPNGTRVAVKALDADVIDSKHKEFRAEVLTISVIHHVNLVRLVGFCSEGPHRLLVYEFMEKGSLDRWLFNVVSPSLNLDPKPYPNPNPNPSSNPNSNPNPNPSPYPNSDSNAYLNLDLNPYPNRNRNRNPDPNPNPNPYPYSNTYPNLDLNPYPNLDLSPYPYPNPNPNLYPNLDLNPYPNLNPDPNPNPYPNLDLNPYRNPNPNPNAYPNLDLNPYPNPNPNPNPYANSYPNPSPNPNPAYPDANPNPDPNSDPSLDSNAYPDSDRHGPLLPWEIRFRVARETARALAYLHDDCRGKILHLDIKPQNILLDSSFHAKVSDFGLARCIDRDGAESRIITTMRGTPGYLAPEWLVNAGVTDKCDVYSYGMVLLELVSGRRNVDHTQDSENWYFPAVAYRKASERKLFDVVDPNIRDSADPDQVNLVIQVAFWCVQDNPKRRPSMSKVVKMLEGSDAVPEPPLAGVFSFSNPTFYHHGDDGYDCNYNDGHHGHEYSSKTNLDQTPRTQVITNNNNDDDENTTTTINQDEVSNGGDFMDGESFSMSYPMSSSQCSSSRPTSSLREPWLAIIATEEGGGDATTTVSTTGSRPPSFTYVC